jgi:vacuolar-type H+-ATPase subunit H
MVEDVLTIVRKTEDEAEQIISRAREEAKKKLNKSSEEARKKQIQLEGEGKQKSEEIIKKARITGGKEGAKIIEAEQTLAEKLERESKGQLKKGVKLIVDSVLNIGGD